MELTNTLQGHPPTQQLEILVNVEKKRTRLQFTNVRHRTAFSTSPELIVNPRKRTVKLKSIKHEDLKLLEKKNYFWKSHVKQDDDTYTLLSFCALKNYLIHSDASSRNPNGRSHRVVLGSFHKARIIKHILLLRQCLTNFCSWKTRQSSKQSGRR